jgi:hypothetical protein
MFVDKQIVTFRINDSYRLIFDCLMTLFELYGMRLNIMKHGAYCKKKKDFLPYIVTILQPED